MKYECEEHEEELKRLNSIIMGASVRAGRDVYKNPPFERCPWCRKSFDVPGMFIDTKGNSTFEGDVTISGDWSPLDSHG